jgi:hypothetical protein
MVSTATAGSKTFTVTATDHAGNLSTKAVSYVVDPVRIALSKSVALSALRRGVPMKVSGLRPGARVTIRLRNGTRSLVTIKGTAAKSGTLSVKLKLSPSTVKHLKKVKRFTVVMQARGAGGVAQTLTATLRLT